MNTANSIVALIPARAGSERIINKNIYEIAGHPLLAYSINTAIESGIFDSVVLVTDSEYYAEIGSYYGAEIPGIRPKEISTSKSPDIEWVEWILDKLKKLNKNYDIFSILRPTSPFRRVSTIQRAQREFLNANVDSLRAVQLAKQHPGKMWVVEDKVMRPLITGEINGVPWHSSQFAALPKIYSQNASLEISWTKNVHLKHSITGTRVAPFLSEGLEGFDLNSNEDLVLLQYYLKEIDNILEPIKKKPFSTKM